MNLAAIPARSSEGYVQVVVEIPRGSRNKYEYDQVLGVIALDRVLYSAVHYPTDYGFVPSTQGTDGQPLDVLVLVEEPTFPGCLVRIRLVGVLTIEHGTPEQKLLGVPVHEPRFAEYQDLGDVPAHLLTEIEHFFEVYKELEGSHIHAVKWEGPQQAEAVLDNAIRD
jgi:inorganic pyrophosphatase